jgi:hypothetical protein
MTASGLRQQTHRVLVWARNSARFRQRYGFAPPPGWSDWSGYERLLDVLGQRLAVPGDVLEIGVFLGGGTYKLCRFLEHRAPEKRVYALDVFDPDFDASPCLGGIPMTRLYQGALKGGSQRDIYQRVTTKCRNLTTLEGDSAAVPVPEVPLCLAFIDGNHAREYVRSDFELVWKRLSVGGVVCLHDYGHDLPEVTAEIHRLIGRYAEQIARVWVEGIMIFIEHGAPTTAV